MNVKMEDIEMGDKILVAYFSAETGRTRKAAEGIAKLTGGDIFEIKPVEGYTKSDINWKNPFSRMPTAFSTLLLYFGFLTLAGKITVWLCSAHSA